MGNPTHIILSVIVSVKHIDTNICSVYTVVLHKETHYSRKEVSTAYTLSDSGIQTIVRTIMPDLYLIQTYMDNYVCEGPEDYDDEISVEDEDSSTAAASPD